MQLSEGEQILLDVLAEPFVATPGGGVEPIPMERLLAIWREAIGLDETQYLEPA